MSPDNDILLAAVVACFSVVHSIFGIGLLLFGTPTLLLLGFDFAEAIAALLPCSLMIDMQQLRKGLPTTSGFVKHLFVLTLPFVCIGLFAVLQGLNAAYVTYAIGAMLLLVGLIRCSKRAMLALQYGVRNHHIPYMAAMGFIHGLSNMGGGLLAVLAGSRSQDKEEIRRLIASGYAMFAATQLLMLLAFSPTSFELSRLYLVPVAALVYLVSNNIFKRLSGQQFQHLLTGLIIVYGTLVILK